MSIRAPRVTGVAATFLVGTLLFLAVPAGSVAAGNPAPIQVAVVVPLSINAGATGILSAAELETATAPGGYLQRMLASVVGTSATLAIDPMVIASIRLLGDEAPESALLWLESLATASNDTFALSYADSNITVALQAGTRQVLAPTSFAFAIDPERFAEPGIEGAPTVAPDETTDNATPDGATSQPVPTTESLTAWDYTIKTIAWPLAGSTTNSDVDSIVASGFSTTILNSGNVQRRSSTIAAVARDGGDLLITDDAASTQLGYALAAQTEPVWAASIGRLATQVAAMGSTSSRATTMVMSTGRGGLVNPERLTSSLSVIDALPRVALVGLSTIAGGPHTTARIIDQPNLASTIERVTPLLQAESADQAFSSVAANPELITGERRIRLLAALAPHWDRYPGGWGSEIAGFITSSAALRNAVRVVESSEIFFAADRGLLPITVRNDLAQSVTVVITVRPLTPLLAIEDSQFELSIEPDSQRRALIPAQSRSNGTVQLEVSIRTTEGLSVGPTTTVVARVQAGWETPVTLALAVFVVLIFGIGLFRTVRKRRAARTAIAE